MAFWGEGKITASNVPPSSSTSPNTNHNEMGTGILEGAMLTHPCLVRGKATRSPEMIKVHSSDYLHRTSTQWSRDWDMALGWLGT